MSRIEKSLEHVALNWLVTSSPMVVPIPGMKNKVAGEEDGRSSGMEDELQRPGDNRQVKQKQQTSILIL